MADYSHLKKLAVQGQRALPYRFSAVEGDPPPTIWSLPATEDNKEFYNASLRISAARTGTGSLNADRVEQTRQEERELLATTCVERWEHVVDADGAAVPFSKEECLAFFNALPGWVFDGYRAWVSNPRNFTLLAGEGGNLLGEG